MNERMCKFTVKDMERIVAACRRYDEVVPCRELARGGHIIALRHDVDNDMNEVPGMLAWEVANGLRSTYFFQHDLDYFGTPLMLGLCKLIEACGCEVGIHNNAIAHRILTGTDERTALAHAVKTLTDAGIDVQGASAHGHRLCSQLHFTNAECFTEVAPRYRFGEPTREIGGKALEPFTKEDVGLAYIHEWRPDVRLMGATDVGGEMHDLEVVEAWSGASVISMHPQRWPV